MSDSLRVSRPVFWCKTAVCATRQLHRVVVAPGCRGPAVPHVPFRLRLHSRQQATRRMKSVTMMRVSQHPLITAHRSAIQPAWCFRTGMPPRSAQHHSQRPCKGSIGSAPQRHNAAAITISARRRPSLTVAKAGGNAGGDEATGQQDWTRKATSAGLFALWAAFVGYAFTFAPNQTPFRDQLFLEKLVGINPSSTINVGVVFFNLFNIMGVYPALYAAMLVPAAKSRNNIPTAPFVVASFGVGMFSLLPYFALWSPLPRDERTLPPKSELGFFRKALESRVTAGLLLAAAAFLLGSAAVAGWDEWYGYFKLFDESRFVHVTTIDFLLLTAFMPFWISNDAEFRGKFEGTALLFGLLPVIGPALYLCLRPRSE